MHDLIKLFIDQIKETTWVQWLAFALGVTEVLLARKNNILLYPAGILGTSIVIYSLLDVGLYAESILNAYYVIMSVYGWWYWIKKRNEPPVEISWSTKKEWGISIAISVIGWVFFYVLLKNLPA